MKVPLRKLIWLFFGLAGAVLVTSLAMLLWLYFGNLNLLKPYIEDYVSEASGYEFRIDGGFSLDVAGQCVLIAENLTLHHPDAETAATAEIARIGRLEVRLDLRSLFFGPVRVEFFDLDDTRIHVSAGMLNRENDGEDADQDDASRSVLFEHVFIDDFEVVYDDPKRDRPLALNISSLRQHRKSDGFLELTVAATFNDKKLNLGGEVGTWDAILAGRDIHYDIEFDLDTLDVESRGIIDNIRTLRRPTLEFSARSPSINDLTVLLGLGDEGAGTIDLSGSLRAKDDGPLQLAIYGNVGSAEVTVAGSFSDLQQLDEVDLDVRMSGPDLGRIVALGGIKLQQKAPFEISLEARRRGPELTISEMTMAFGAATLTGDALVPQFPSLENSHISIRAEGPDVVRLRDLTGLKGGATGPFQLRVDTQADNNGGARLDAFFETSLVRITAQSELGPDRENPLSEIEFTIAGESFAAFVAAFAPIEYLPDEAFDLAGDIRLADNGIDLRSIIGNIGPSEIQVEGHISPTDNFAGSHLTVAASGDDARFLLRGVSGYEAPEAKFSARLAGELDGANVRIDEFTFELGAATLSASGDVNLRDDDVNTNLTFRGDIPDLAAIGQWNGRALNSQAFSWRGDVVGNANELRVGQLSAKLGDSDIAASVLVQKGDIPNIEVNIRSALLKYTAILEEESNIDYQPEPDFADGRLIPDIAAPFDTFGQVNLSVDIEVEELQRGTLAMSDIRLQAKLRDGALAIENLSYRARAGRFSARGRLDPADGGSASLQIVARDVAIGLAESSRDRVMTGDIDVNLEATGFDLRALLGSANGVVFIDTRGGRMPNNRFLHAMYGSLLDEILGTINPFRRSQEYTDYECMVLPMRFENGVATALPYAFVSTDKVRISLNPELNFATEEMLIDIRTRPRKALGVSAGEFLNPFIRVQGSMVAPRLAVDEQGVLISGGVAVATGGLSLLARAAWNRLSGGSDPCGKLSEKGRQELASLFPGIRIEDEIVE